MKQMLLMCVSTILLAVTSPINAQSIKGGALSIDGPNEAEFGYYRLDNQRWIVAVQTRESTRTKVTQRKTPSALLITCSKDKIRLQGFTFFDAEKLSPESKLSYDDVIAITFCKNMQRSFGVEIPDMFMPKSN